MGAPLSVSPESLLLLKLAKAVKEIKARQPEKGDAGREPTAEEVFTAVSLWMAFNPDAVRGEPGKSPKAVPGPAGVGIDDLDVEDGHLVVILTDGRKKRFKLPELKDRRYNTTLLGAGGTGGISAEQVQQLIDEAIANMPFDDYKQIEYLAEQAGDGTVKTFSFSAAVQFIVVEMISTLDQDTQAAVIETLEGSAASGTTVPTMLVGAVLKHEIPVTLLDDTATCRVLAPVNTRLRVYGKRRVAV